MVCSMCDPEGNLCDRCKMMDEGNFREPEDKALEEYEASRIVRGDKEY